MGRKLKNYFQDSLMKNNRTYLQYYNRLMELSMSMFEWNNLPETVDPRYIEMVLFADGQAVFFKDDVTGDALCLSCVPQGRLNIYGYPVLRRAFSRYNNFQYRNLDESNSVVIYNNYLRTNSALDVKMFAERLYNLDRIIDVNANAQKTPVLLQGTEQQRLTLLNLYKEYDGNAPVIFGDKNLDINGLKSINTQAPYIADKIYELKSQIWNEALTYLGISNINYQKKERLISDEVTRGMGGTVASRYSRLEARKEAVDKINAMFGTDITVEYRQDSVEMYEEGDTEEGGDDNE